jgi:hypothetical protein
MTSSNAVDTALFSEDEVRECDICLDNKSKYITFNCEHSCCDDFRKRSANAVCEEQDLIKLL